MSDERIFGKLQNELEVNGLISDEYDRDSFVNDLRIMYNMAVEYDREYYGDDLEDPEDLFENYSPLTLKVLDDISKSIKVDGDMVSGEIELIVDMLNSGDMDDAFGSEGWNHRLGWD